MQFPENKTKIVCTIGPASASREVIETMIVAGMNVARLNFSHGDLDTHAALIENLRSASQVTGKRVVIMADLPGPKIRIGKVAPEPISLTAGDYFTFTTNETVGDRHGASVSFANLPKVLQQGDILFVNDGLVQMQVAAVQDNEVICKILVGGELRSGKGLNLPGVDLGLCAFTDRDYECLKFALEHGIYAISQSFVESKNDVDAVRNAATSLGYAPFIIAKIERSRALDRIDEILEAADGLMVARGDLGVEIPLERIAIVQKEVIRKANLAGKPVITATQMLESMVTNRRPTRAEATDVANAVLDGTDCVMLSEESALGEYPVDSTAMLTKISRAVETHQPDRHAREARTTTPMGHRINVVDLISSTADDAWKRMPMAGIVVPTQGGGTARELARLRLPVWITAVSSDEKTCDALQFSYGVYPVFSRSLPEDWTNWTIDWLRASGTKGDFALLVTGPSPGHPRITHSVEIIDYKST